MSKIGEEFFRSAHEKTRMLRGVIVIFFVSMVGRILADITMILNFFRRGGKWRTLAPELLLLLSGGTLGRTYLDLLQKDQLKSTRFDRLLHLVENVLQWSIISSAILFVLLLLFESLNRE